MTPDQQALVLIEDFNDIVNDMEKSKECAIYHVEKVMKIEDYAKDWWKEVLQAIKQY